MKVRSIQSFHSSLGRLPLRSRSSKHEFENPDKFFNCGFIARSSNEVISASRKEELEDWNVLLLQLRKLLARLFGSDDPARKTAAGEKHVSLFHNTTGAVQRVLGRVLNELGGSGVTLLTTDLEYPGCIAALDDQWLGTLVLARVAGFIYGDANGGQVAEAALRKAFLISRPRVVYLSHVSRSTGHVISTNLLRFMKEVNPRCLIILDGSQAVGNISVESDILAYVDFYLTSGHKWLGGVPALGIVWSRDRTWRIDDPAQSLALSSGSGGTANLAAMQSLQMALTDLVGLYPEVRLAQIARRNREIATVFLRELRRRLGRDHIKPIGGAPQSGLLALTVPDIKVVRKLEGKDSAIYKGFTHIAREDFVHRFRASVDTRLAIDGLEGDKPQFVSINLENEPVPLPPEETIRFCFHYYHTADEARKLAAIVADAVSTIN